MIDIIAGLLVITIAAVSYKLVKDMALTLLITLAGILIINTLKKMISTATENSHPPLNVYTLTCENLQNTETMGVRILLMTQGIFFHTETKPDLDYLINLSNEYLVKLGEENERFRFRYNYVTENNMPILINYCACGNSKGSVRRHYASWNSQSGTSTLKNVQNDRDAFGYDAEITDPRDGSIHKTMLWVIFDPNLPTEA